MKLIKKALIASMASALVFTSTAQAVTPDMSISDVGQSEALNDNSEFLTEIELQDAALASGNLENEKQGTSGDPVQVASPSTDNVSKSETSTTSIADSIDPKWSTRAQHRDQYIFLADNQTVYPKGTTAVVKGPNGEILGAMLNESQLRIESPPVGTNLLRLLLPPNLRGGAEKTEATVTVEMKYPDGSTETKEVTFPLEEYIENNYTFFNVYPGKTVTIPMNCAIAKDPFTVITGETKETNIGSDWKKNSDCSYSLTIPKNAAEGYAYLLFGSPDYPSLAQEIPFVILVDSQARALAVQPKKISLKPGSKKCLKPQLFLDGKPVNDPPKTVFKDATVNDASQSAVEVVENANGEICITLPTDTPVDAKAIELGVNLTLEDGTSTVFDVHVQPDPNASDTEGSGDTQPEDVTPEDPNAGDGNGAGSGSGTPDDVETPGPGGSMNEAVGILVPIIAGIGLAFPLLGLLGVKPIKEHQASLRFSMPAFRLPAFPALPDAQSSQIQMPVLPSMPVISCRPIRLPLFPQLNIPGLREIVIPMHTKQCAPDLQNAYFH
ncbi:hypothetical protein [Corynebacterium caspium]|uniref:hypothetical protein n=1 Tax=Corynebacterium caspium TaxID=234828 RepID=UPI00036EE8A8|nr:hypothetical protein [Corynebacterium caspium]WKD59832.1 hypothetical protein CCASP_07265 [Corynebacterium caspium DSM 44850]